jgi:putative membrane protein
LSFPQIGKETNMTRASAFLALISLASATCAVAQSPPPKETDPSAASSPHQRQSTSTDASEAPATKDAEPSAASTPHQQQVTKGSETMKSVAPASFASQAAIIGKAEIELGQIALKNTKDANVRAFAERMIRDHTASDNRLKAIAAKENLQLPQSLDQEHESLKMKLQGMTGDAFDREYVKAMAKGHDKAVALFESASQQPQMPADLKQFAAKTLPTLEQHKEMAHSLHAKEGA